MKIEGKAYRSIWHHPEKEGVVCIIDQRHLPHRFVVEELRTVEQAEDAIREMHVRGAPLIGITAAFGMYLAARALPPEVPAKAALREAAELLNATRPTAVNLAWAIRQQFLALVASQTVAAATPLLLKNAIRLADEDTETCKKIGEHGLPLIEEIFDRKDGAAVNILTHCNAGWLACVDYGTATSPMYAAHEAGIPIHVWVDETRPRNQGARLTAWELGQHGIPHTVIPDNTGGHLMQHGMVDIVIVGSDRTTLQGDVANKIGTYLKALAAKDNDVPFYVALPRSTFDLSLRDGVKEIPIETRSEREVKAIRGLDGDEIREVLLTPKDSPAINYGFDVTPARLVTGLITEKGIFEASEEGIRGLFEVGGRRPETGSR